MLKAAVSGAVGGISSFRGTSEARAETGRGVGESWGVGVGGVAQSSVPRAAPGLQALSGNWLRQCVLRLQAGPPARIG